MHVFFGVYRYYSCIHNPAVRDCTTDGPQLSSWDAFFWLIQILLVWLSFFFLPYSRRYRDPKTKRFRENQRYNFVQKTIDWFGNEIDMSRGGHLKHAVTYETVVVSVTFLVVVTLILFSDGGKGGWEVRGTLYWIRCMYGLSSLPYFLFRLPVLSSLLTHARPTGYNQAGNVVLCLSKNERPWERYVQERERSQIQNRGRATQVAAAISAADHSR
jgi:hypothetical protein